MLQLRVSIHKYAAYFRNNANFHFNDAHELLGDEIATLSYL